MRPCSPTYMCLHGDIVACEEVRIHAFSGAVKYGCAVFEGPRAYRNAPARELYVFRLREHLERLRFDEIYEAAYPRDGVLRMLRANKLREDTHILVIAFLDGDDELAKTGPVGLRRRGAEADGSGQEIVLIRSVGCLPVGGGEVGPVARTLQARYFALVRGEDEACPEWRTAVWG